MHYITLLSFFCLSFTEVYSTFSHPGLLVTNREITRAKCEIAARRDPWLASWNKLTSIQYSSPSYSPNAVSSVDRSTNGDLLWRDIGAAFNLALRWKISGDDQYADASSDILVAWANKLVTLSGNDDKYLTAGLQGYQLANTVELLREYAPFNQSSLATVVRMLTTVILPLNLKFLEHGESSEHNPKHFFANWELSNVASVMAISVLADNQSCWDFAINYAKNGSGNGAIPNAITNIVNEPGTGTLLGQGQEAGRDQGHSGLDIQLLAVIAQQAWNQGEDLWGFDDNRILRGAEYFARYNLGNDVPFVPYSNGIVNFSVISSASRGAVRPTWELVYQHYAVVKGLPAPWTKQYLNHTLAYFHGFEGGAGSWGEGAGHYDGLGWGSLLFRSENDDCDSCKNLRRRYNHLGKRIRHRR